MPFRMARRGGMRKLLLCEMARTLTPSRFELLRTLQAQGPITLRALARLLKRDVKSVHRDVTPLKELGLVEDHENGISVPKVRASRPAAL